MKLLFDLDGTLIDSNHIWQDIDRSFLEKRGFELTDAYNAGVIYATFLWPPSSPRSTAA